MLPVTETGTKTYFPVDAEWGQLQIEGKTD